MKKKIKAKVKWLYCSMCGKKNAHTRTEHGWRCNCGEIGHDAIVKAQDAIQRQGESYFDKG